MRWLPPAAAVATAAASGVYLSSPSDPKSPQMKLLPRSERADNSEALTALRRRCLTSLTIRREEAAAPGMSLCVSLGGRRLLSGGVGFADVENLIPCNERSVLRVASISKCFTAVLAAQMMEAGQMDFDKPVGEYLTEPEMKKFSRMTVRQLLSHTAGVRSYHRTDSDELENPEYYITKYYASATEATKELLCNDKEAIASEPPGSQFLYSTHGYTLLGAVLERLSGDQPIDSLLKKLFVQMGLSSGTVPEQHAPIIRNRARQYQRSKNSPSTLNNAAYIDNSYKYSGGGVLSCAEDLVAFGELMMRCANGEDCNGILKPDTIKMLWSAVPGTKVNWGVAFTGPYCLGFGTANYRGEQIVLHTGASIGGTSILLMVPRIGAVIAVICNLQRVSLTGLAVSILDAVFDYVQETAACAEPSTEVSAFARF
ncbi:hypothetical protein BOX15_Mlig002868g5 [Macrostomum lignano]|uniref:Uncharacterized protein n=2 Tax=Macrostomum lignano TaxID=282301 RepID=A0A267G6D9_9PLAT|nr:hypothetical protein BOX15_Mlig002868g5 [Macrostomum lignano]